AYNIVITIHNECVWRAIVMYVKHTMEAIAYRENAFVAASETENLSGSGTNVGDIDVLPDDD
ncbi:MAG: hypothetical protein LUG57_04960, partial [Oscillospiraceae bacterium]|nr:hypothetical protein [Oscillospiraceae bacterium]